MTKALTIALAGVGDLGRYLLEELSLDDRYHVAVLTRQKDQKQFDHPKITIHPTDYREDSVLSILNSTNAHALISTIRCPDADYLPLHQGLLNACSRSGNCKRFIPSEWAGNIEDYPHLPRAYGKSRAPFRQILRERIQDVEWTLFNLGWFMDYFVGEDRSYMKFLPGEFPVTLKTWEYVVRGTGNEPQSWTCGRDVAKAVAELLIADKWVKHMSFQLSYLLQYSSLTLLAHFLDEINNVYKNHQEPVTYVSGEWSTFNRAAELMEKFYGKESLLVLVPFFNYLPLILTTPALPLFLREKAKDKIDAPLQFFTGRPFTRHYRTESDIRKTLEEHKDEGDGSEELALAEGEEWQISGATACPEEKTRRQRDRYFSRVHFLSIEEILNKAETCGRI